MGDLDTHRMAPQDEFLTRDGADASQGIVQKRRTPARTCSPPCQTQARRFRPRTSQEVTRGARRHGARHWCSVNPSCGYTKRLDPRKRARAPRHLAQPGVTRTCF